MKRSDFEVMWPILVISALQLTHPKCTHTAVNTHTQTHTPGAVSSQCCGARGAVGGSVSCSRAPQSWYWGWRECCSFTPPPTYNSCRTETRTHSPVRLYPLGHDHCLSSVCSYSRTTRDFVHFGLPFKRRVEIGLKESCEFLFIVPIICQIFCL